MKAWNIPVIASVHSLLPGQQAVTGRINIDGLNRQTSPYSPEIERLAEQIAAYADTRVPVS